MFTAESFGADCPANWEEICDFLNNLAAERGITDDHNAENDLWEEYWNGEIPGVPGVKETATIRMKNIENATMVKRTPEPRNAALPDILIYSIVTDMMDTAWGILEGKCSTVSDMTKMRQTYTDKCMEYSRILYLAGNTDDADWSIRPIFANDTPIADVPDPEEFHVIFPLGVTYNNTVYSYDIESYFSALHCDYVPSVEKMYAEKLAFVRKQQTGDDIPVVLF